MKTKLSYVALAVVAVPLAFAVACSVESTTPNLTSDAGVPTNGTVIPEDAASASTGDDAGATTDAAVIPDAADAALDATADAADAADSAPAPLVPILINEALSDPPDSMTADFIELYNPNSSPVDLAGYSILNVTSSNSMPIASGTIAAHGYFVAVKYPTNGNCMYPGLASCIQLSFGVSASSGAVLSLKDSAANVVDTITVPAALATGKSYSRSPDGSATFAIATTPTPGAANSAN